MIVPMADTASIILDYLRRHHFTKAEAALRGELVNREGANGSPSLLLLDGFTSLSKEGYGEESTNEDKRGHQIQREETGYAQNEDERMRCLTEDIAFEEDRLLVSPDELSPKIGRTNNQSLGQRSLLDSATDTELIVKEVDCNPIKYGPAGDHLNARNNIIINEGDKAAVWTAQRIAHDSSGIGEARNISQQDSARSKILSDLSPLDKYAWSLGAGCNEMKGSAEGNIDNRINTAGKFSESQKAETSVGSKLQVHESPNISNVTRETRKSKTTAGGSLYEEVCVQYPSNTTPRLGGKGNARMPGSAGDQRLLHGREGNSTKEEEKVSWSESANVMDEGIVDSRHQSRFTQDSEAFIQFPSGGVWTDHYKENVSSFHEPLSENIPFKPEERRLISIDPWKERPTNTPFPFPLIDNCSDQGNVLQNVNIKQAVNRGKDFNRQGTCKDSGTTEERSDKEHVSLYMLSSQGSIDQENLESLEIVATPEKPSEELPRLPPVRLKSEEKNPIFSQEGLDRGEKLDRTGSSAKALNMEASFLLGSFLDVPVGQEITSSGGKRTMGSSRLSVSQGIAEDASELVSGQATVGDGLSESVDYPNEYWDSDEYEDDDDLGYIRQPIEDETWFLAHEIDYPSDNEKGTGHGSIPDQQTRDGGKEEDDDQSFVEEDSYFSGEQYFPSKNIEQIAGSEDPVGQSTTEMYGRSDDNDLIAQYDGQLMDEEELNLMRSEPVWKGFVTQNNELVMLGSERVMSDIEQPRQDDFGIDDDQHGSVRSIGVGIHSDVADFGSEVRESLVGGSSEGDVEYFPDREISISGSKQVKYDRSRRTHDMLDKSKELPRQDLSKYDALAENEDGLTGRSYDSWQDRRKSGNNQAGQSISEDQDTVKDLVKRRDADSGRLDFGGFSFPSPSSTGDMVGSKAESGKSLWSTKGNTTACEDTDDYGNDIIGPDDVLASWRRKSNDSSPVISSRDENLINAPRSSHSTASTYSNFELADRELRKRDTEENLNDPREDEEVGVIEDEEAAAVQEQVRQIRAQEDEFETFNLKIVHRKNRTGFEEDKNFHVVLNSVIAGRYHVTEYLGSAAFSKAIQAHDLHTGMDVCMKIIKNNKDFFDQSLDEIKLLKFVNKHDPADKYHILRLYDYFYYREHLFIVCELLKANLYEFHKFNRESGGEVYFTMPRLQSITIQCLEALHFLHGLGLIHCDLKPENILVKSYSRCEVKVIDLGSSCFETDHLCSYVQSRSYRAPEVILGLPYDKKIDIWSLGCILAELCSGNVLFQNDSPATLLARVIGIIDPIEQEMLVKGRDTYKYFTKNHMLYERNQETNRLEYLIPKKTSLRHRLPMGDQGFIDFVSYLLEINPAKRPSATEALKHSWLSYPYEPISS